MDQERLHNNIYNRLHMLKKMVATLGFTRGARCEDKHEDPHLAWNPW